MGFKKFRKKLKKKFKKVAKATFKIAKPVVSQALGSFVPRVPSFAPHLGSLPSLTTPRRATRAVTKRVTGRASRTTLARRSGLRASTALDVITGVLDPMPSKAHAPTVGPGMGAMVPSHPSSRAQGQVPAIPVGGQMSKQGLPLMVQTHHRTVRAVPAGYVVVRHPTLGSVGMLRSAAIAAGLYRPRRKPPISAGDWRKLQVADRVKKKAKSVASKAGYTCSVKGRTRATSKRR